MPSDPRNEDSSRIISIYRQDYEPKRTKSSSPRNMPLIPQQRSKEIEEMDMPVTEIVRPNLQAVVNEFETPSERPAPTELMNFTINAQVRYEFRGYLIGHASSEEIGKSIRWTEIDIYRTESGSYISHTQGISLVYHHPSHPRASGRLVSVGYLLDTEAQSGHSDDDALHMPCPDCERDVNPETGRPYLLPLDVYPRNQQLKRESIRHTVKVAKPPRAAFALVDNLYQARARDGSRFLSGVSTQALAEARRNDPALQIDQMSVHIE